MMITVRHFFVLWGLMSGCQALDPDNEPKMSNNVKEAITEEGAKRTRRIEDLKVDQDAAMELETLLEVNLKDLAREMKTLYEELHQKELKDRIIMIRKKRELKDTVVYSLDENGYISPIMVVDKDGVSVTAKDRGKDGEVLVIFWSADGKSILSEDPNNDEYKLAETTLLTNKIYLLLYAKNN